MIKKIQEIAIFPLNGALLLPNSNLPLNIFEDRYLSMIDYSLASNKHFGMIQFKNKENKKLYSIGCLGKITSFNETLDKKYVINLFGTSKFEIIKEITTEKSFRIFNVEIIDNKNYYDLNKSFDRKSLIANVRYYFQKIKVDIDWSYMEKINNEELINAIAVICPFENNEKQMLLESKNINDLGDKLIAILEFNNNKTNTNESIN
jgi:Lon protease-like protein